MNFYPRHVGPFLQLPPADQLQLCEAVDLCMGIAAWSFAVTDRGLAPPIAPTICCFDCVDDLDSRAQQIGVAIQVVRLQPDLCQACGRLVFGPRHTIDRIAVGGTLSHFADQVGPFCGPLCAMRWSHKREGLS